MLIGTEGWRSRFGTILALFAGPTITNHTREMGVAAAAYGIPLYRDLDAMVLVDHRAGPRSFPDRLPDLLRTPIRWRTDIEEACVATSTERRITPSP